ncbi:peptidyl-prolyl cis-trans isomerase zonda [Oratosquilla oratoria]|uniref:peptidyl-prolyl cis-trans isomerase zonda n=1 Tax=Oratosquilla oratoria TaxID=337810 RepID=UPI003F7774F7
MPEITEVEEKVERVEEIKEGKEEVMDVDGTEEVEVEGESDPAPDEWMDILGSGDLKKKILKAGIVESRPSKGHTVCVRLSGRLEDETLVDKEQELTFTVGDAEVITGIELTVPLMDKGEIAELYVGSRFAYGEKGLPPDIPGNTNLYYTMELVDFSPEVEPENLSVKERHDVGNRKRERGNWWYNRGEYMQAIQCYSAAIDFLDDTSDDITEDATPEVIEILEERLKALNNMAAAQIKLEAYEPATKALDAVLKCQPLNVKALFRKGKVLSIEGKTKEAYALLCKAHLLEPESRVIHQEKAKVAEKIRKEAESEKSLYRRMLGIKSDTSKPKERYRTLKSFPWKPWLVSFCVIMVALVGYRYRSVLQQPFQ